MADNPRYITQISSEWLDRVSRNTNLKPGPGIKLTPDGDGLKVEIDQEVFKQWIWAAVTHGLIYATPPLGVVPLSNIGDVSLDPGV